MASRRRRATLNVVGVLILFTYSCCGAQCDPHRGSTPLLAVVGEIMTGPLVGWRHALGSGRLLNELQVVLSTTGMCLGPLVAYLLQPSLERLMVAVSFWYLVGFTLAVAIWV